MTEQATTTTTQRAGANLLVRTLLLGSLTSLTWSSPMGVLGDVGDVYVIASADVGAGPGSPAVLQYDGATGSFVGPFAFRIGGQFNGMAWSPNGNLYASQMLNTTRWRIAEFDGTTGAFIQNVIDMNDGTATIAKGLTFGPDGDLYVGDFWKQTVTRYDGTTFAIKAVTPPGEIVGTPSGMHFAPNGNLFVLSGGFNSIREYDVSGGGVNYLGDFAVIPGATQPQDFTWGPNGNIFITRGSVGGVAEVDGITGAYLGDFVPADSSLPTNGLAFDDFGRLMTSIVFPVSRIDSYDAITGASTGAFITAELGANATPTIIAIKEAPLNSGNAYCLGDGTGVSCPCGANGNPGEGCANTTGAGATLTGFGDANFAGDSFQLQASGIPATQAGLCVKGSAQLGGGNGILIGDGLLCTSPQIRSQVITSDGSGNVSMGDWRGQPFGTYPVAANAGAPTYYQWWYRDPANTCSGVGFNFTNAWEVTWTP